MQAFPISLGSPYVFPLQKFEAIYIHAALILVFVWINKWGFHHGSDIMGEWDMDRPIAWPIVGTHLRDIMYNNLCASAKKNV
jgi:hypothetical protein